MLFPWYYFLALPARMNWTFPESPMAQWTLLLHRSCFPACYYHWCACVSPWIFKFSELKDHIVFLFVVSVLNSSTWSLQIPLKESQRIAALNSRSHQINMVFSASCGQGHILLSLAVRAGRRSCLVLGFVIRLMWRVQDCCEAGAFVWSASDSRQASVGASLLAVDWANNSWEFHLGNFPDLTWAALWACCLVPGFDDTPAIIFLCSGCEHHPIASAVPCGVSVLTLSLPCRSSGLLISQEDASFLHPPERQRFRQD